MCGGIILAVCFLQELEHQVQELTHQLGTGPHSVPVLELESECKLAEERIAELESQLATTAPVLGAGISRHMHSAWLEVLNNVGVCGTTMLDQT